MAVHSVPYSSGNHFHLKWKYLIIRHSRSMGPPSLWTFQQEICKIEIRRSIYVRLNSVMKEFYRRSGGRCHHVYKKDAFGGYMLESDVSMHQLLLTAYVSIGAGLGVYEYI